MTTCIVALAENGARAILCSDQLLTHGFMSWAMESPEVPKIHWLSDGSAILTSGDASHSHEIVRRVRANLASGGLQGDFSETVRATYGFYRLTKAEQLHLLPRGLTLEEFMNRHATLQPEIVRDLDNKMASFDLGAQLLAVNYADGECHLAMVWNPGLVAPQTVGYAAIGEGTPHVLYSMLDLGYNKTLPLDKVREIVLEAKKKSEKAKSVGEATVIFDFPKPPQQPPSEPPA